MSRARDLADGTFSGAFSADSPTLVVDDTNNRVGIGTASPTSNLQLDGAEDRTGGLTLSAGAQNHTYFLSSDYVNVHNIETSSAAAAHTWQTNGTEVARITPNGLTFNGDTAAANALDDYEEGTWTPAFVGLSNTPTFYNHSGKYTKIGNIVILQYFVQNGATTPTFTSNTAAFKVSGVPFVPSASGYTASQGSINAQGWSWNTTNNTANVTGQVSSSVNASSQVQFHVTANGGTRGEVNNGSMAGAGRIIEATIIYRTA